MKTIKYDWKEYPADRYLPHTSWGLSLGRIGMFVIKHKGDAYFNSQFYNYRGNAENYQTSGETLELAKARTQELIETEMLNDIIVNEET